MILDWNADGDFDGVIDTLEEVTLKRVGCEDSVTTDAWRFAEQTTEFADSGGAVRVVESTWQLPMPDGLFTPKVGDRVIDSESNCSTLYSLEVLRGATRLRALARRVVIDPSAAEWFDLEQAVWDLQQSTEDPIDWTPRGPALRGHASRTSVDTDAADPAVAVEQYRLVFTEKVEATTDDRFVSSVGDAYRVVSQGLSHQLGRGWSYLVSRMT